MSSVEFEKLNPHDRERALFYVRRAEAIIRRCGIPEEFTWSFRCMDGTYFGVHANHYTFQFSLGWHQSSCAQLLDSREIDQLAGSFDDRINHMVDWCCREVLREVMRQNSGRSAAS